MNVARREVEHHPSMDHEKIVAIDARLEVLLVFSMILPPIEFHCHAVIRKGDIDPEFPSRNRLCVFPLTPLTGDLLTAEVVENPLEDQAVLCGVPRTRLGPE